MRSTLLLAGFAAIAFGPWVDAPKAGLRPSAMVSPRLRAKITRRIRKPAAIGRRLSAKLLRRSRWTTKSWAGFSAGRVSAQECC